MKKYLLLLIVPLLFFNSLVFCQEEVIFRGKKETMRNGNENIISSAYPVIFIHGLAGNKQTWQTFNDYLINKDWNWGGYLEYCLNSSQFSTQDYLDVQEVNSNSTLNEDGELFIIDFDCDVSSCVGGSSVYSNQSSITKQGFALGHAIDKVLDVTGKDKVILMGHSMGGLCAREYLQNSNHWLAENHRVAKLITSGTPHGGSNVGDIFEAAGLSAMGININSEAVRDLRRDDDIPFFDVYLGPYLFGGSENIELTYLNTDINSDGDESDNIIGLNQKKIPIDLDYACIVGDITSMPTPPESSNTLSGIFSTISEFIFDATAWAFDLITTAKTQNGDGAVYTYSANLENYYYQMEDLIEVFNVNNIHLDILNNYLPGFLNDLTSNNEINFNALDEPDFAWICDPYTLTNCLPLAYKIECYDWDNEANKYRGTFTEQAEDQYFESPNEDSDIYKFIIDQPQYIDIQLIAHPNSNATIELFQEIEGWSYASDPITYDSYSPSLNDYVTFLPSCEDGEMINAFGDCNAGFLLDAGTWYISVQGNVNINTSNEYELTIMPYDPYIWQNNGIVYEGNCGNGDVFGCTSSIACNYSYFATVDNGSCIYPTAYFLDCDGNCLNDLDGDNLCDQIDSCIGFIDECGVCNGNGPELYYDCFGNCLNDLDNDDVCDEIDSCVGYFDECGICNGSGPELYYDCLGNCLNDIDNDNYCDELDNCPEDYNPNQEDFNSDNIGDACDGIGLNEEDVQKKLIKVVDILGRDLSKENKDAIFLLIYDDGSVEQKYVIE